MKKIKKIICSIFALLALTVTAGGFYVLNKIGSAKLSMLPPENATSTTMYVLKRRILFHTTKHDELPQSLETLIEIDGFDSRTNDYWGNKIQYSVDGNIVTLRSNGKDMMPGGINDDLDVIGIFEAKTSRGEWADYNNDVEWQKRPLYE